MARRVRYRNWIAELGFDPNSIGPEMGRLGQQVFLPLDTRAMEISDQQVYGDFEERRRVRYIRDQVSAAVSQLSDDEREFVERYYFSGESFREMSDRSGKAIHRLEAIQRRALRRLKKLLREFAAETFGVRGPIEAACPICESAHTDEIDRLIQERDRTRSWRPIMREIDRKFGIVIRSPMTLIGHEKYH